MYFAWDLDIGPRTPDSHRANILTIVGLRGSHSSSDSICATEPPATVPSCLPMKLFTRSESAVLFLLSAAVVILIVILMA